MQLNKSWIIKEKMISFDVNAEVLGKSLSKSGGFSIQDFKNSRVNNAAVENPT